MSITIRPAMTPGSGAVERSRRQIMAGSFLVPMELPHLDAALRDLGSATAEVRWVAALALAQDSGVRADEAIAGLGRLTEDPVEEVRAQALEGLVGHARAGRQVQSRMIEQALEDRSDLVRMTAVEAVELFAADPVAAAIRLLRDDAPGVRIAAVRTLSELDATEGTDSLAALLGDTDEVVRIEAAIALVRRGDSRGERLATEALKSDEPTAIEAALALGRLGNPEAAPALFDVASRWLRSAEVKSVAAAALVRCGDSRGLTILGRQLSSVRSATRIAALSAISRLPAPGIANRVGALLDHGGTLEPSVALRTLVVLGEVDREAALDEVNNRRGKLKGELAVELEETVAELEQGA